MPGEVRRIPIRCDIFFKTKQCFADHLLLPLFALLRFGKLLFAYAFEQRQDELQRAAFDPFAVRMRILLLGKISGGEIRFMGQRIDGKKGHDIAGMGLAQCLEGRHVFGNLTVKENLQMGAYLRRDADGIKRDFEYVYNLFPRLKEREAQGAKTLSGGEQQMLAVGRALMQSPKLLMMDEPSLGLAPLVIQEIFNTIKRINADGIPILLIEQNSNAALKVANRGYVIENGEIVLADTSANLLANEDVKKAYLGGQ